MSTISKVPVDLLPLIVSILDRAQDDINRMTGFKVKLTMNVGEGEVNVNEVIWTKFQQELCGKGGFTWKKLISNSRKHPLPLYRQAYCYFGMNKLGGKSLVKIGAELGGRDHTTIIHSVNRFSELLETRDDAATELFTHLQKMMLNANQTEQATI
jgi:chromosomal replication initiation ATPase DnaA